MTTSHRPTLESRRARDLQPTSIVHGRKVAAHRQLKYRNSEKKEDGANYIDEKDAKEKLKELKHELIEREKQHYKKLKGDDYDYKDRQLALEDNKDVEDPKVEETYEERMQRVAAETKDLDDSSDSDDDDDNNNNNEGSGDESEDNNQSSSEEDASDSDDEAELLRELEKIKKEKAEAQLRKQQKEKEESAINSNPLLNPNKPIRKNWRQDKVFNYKNNSEKKKTDDDYVNDLLRSDFHQKFMNKYVK